MNTSSNLSYSSEKNDNNRGESAMSKVGSQLSSVQLEKVPRMVGTDAFLWGAIGSIGLSALLQTIGKKETSNFVGQWVPTLLILGLYSKITKQTRGAEESEE
jgi:hypothetical protein